MKILLITPTYFPSTTGNAVCTERIALGLKKEGNKVLIFTPNNMDYDKINEFKPDVIHGLHAYRCRIVRDLSKRLNIPYVITLTGSDYEECIEKSVVLDNTLVDQFKREKTLKVMQDSNALVVYNQKTLKNVLSKVDFIENKIFVVGKNQPIIYKTNWSFRDKFNISRDDFVFTLVAGVRSRKNNLFPVKALEKLNKKYKNITLVLVGPVSDERYEKQLKRKISSKKWVKYVGLVNFDKMYDVYKGSDVILNSSHYEGESNAIIEAMFFEKTVLASAVPGNVPLIYPEKNGLLYCNEDIDDFQSKAERLYLDRDFKKELAKNAKMFVNKLINLNEAVDYQKIYKNIIG